jgi:uncharacterized protein (PEP-CTERM system associated)
MGVDRIGCRKREATFRSGFNSTRLRGASRMRVAHGQAAWVRLLAAMGCVFAATPVLAENWKIAASAGVTETYTTNANYVPGRSDPDFVTSVGATLSINGDGARLKLNGSIGATELLYARHTENNSFAPQVNLTGLLEAIEKFAYVEARAYVSQTFVSPFGAQPGNLVNATQNRNTQGAYAVSPYIKGVLGSSNLSYQLRDDNIWTIASNFGDSATAVPNTFANLLNGSISSPVSPWGWTLEYSRSYYDNGLSNSTNAGRNSFTTQIARLLLPYQIDPQLQIAPRIGYEDNQFPFTSSRDVVYGIGGQWNPSDRTNVSGFWEHRFFGGSYSAQLSHRLPNAALSANFARGITSSPQQALLIPAGASVAQFLDSAFATRIPNPAERSQAVEQFLAKTGLPPTLASPVSFYAPNITVQQSATVSLVLIGALNALTFNFFNVIGEAISGSGAVLPPALQFGQNNTQTGGGIGFSHRLSGLTNLSASFTYSRTTTNTTDGPLSNARSNNGYAVLNLSTQFGPKTSGSAGINYSRTESPGNVFGGNTSALNIFAGINHTF